MRTAFGPEGDIRSTDILAALVALWREGASGSLRFSRSGATSTFELASGEVIGATSSDPRFDTAAILVRAGKLESSTLDRLVTPPGADRALSALEAGILTKREWRWGEKIRAVEVLSDLLTWLEGDYSFFRKGTREAGEFRLTIPRLILELFLRSRDRGLVLHHLGGADVPLARDARFDAEFATFGLTDDAESVVRLIDGESTAADIAAEAPAEAFAVEKLLAALVTLGLVHPAYAVEEASSDVATRRIDLEAAAPAVSGPSEMPEEEQEEEAPDEEAPVELPRRADEDEEELEPEVDIEEKFEAPPPPPVPEYDEMEEEPRPLAAAEEEELVDADLDGGAVAEARLHERDEEDEDSESERLAADLVAADAGRDRAGRDEEGLAASEPVPDVYGSDPGEAERESVHGAVEALEDRDDREEAVSAPFDDLRQRPLDTSTGVGSLERPRHRSSLPLIAILAILVAATAALLLWRARSGEAGADGTTVAAAAAAVEPSPVPETDVAPPAAAPTAAAAMPVPTVAAPPPTSAPAATPAPTTRPAATARPTPSAAPRNAAAGSTARPRSRQGWLERAERDQKSAASDRDARFTVQLELACEVPSLSEAFAHDRAGSMWLVPTSFRGKTCFRVLWGRYATREAAESGLAAAPAFFSTPRNRPMVVALKEGTR